MKRETTADDLNWDSRFAIVSGFTGLISATIAFFGIVGELDDKGIDVGIAPIFLSLLAIVSGSVTIAVGLPYGLAKIRSFKDSINGYSYKFDNQMENKALMLLPETDSQEFDFDSMLGDESYQTISGIRVKIDKVIRDVTKTTVIGVSGVMIVKGVKIRGVWDCYGQILECRKMLELSVPKNMFKSLDNIFCGAPESMFRLVNVKETAQSQDQ